MILWICPTAQWVFKYLFLILPNDPESSAMPSAAPDYPPPSMTAVLAAIFSSQKQARTALQVFSGH